ncbi:MAG: purine-nucleoside phosphorylase [Campylobacter sp.]|nr:purine-nucleoside phosphorylase [Campylobacter sp.]
MIVCAGSVESFKFAESIGVGLVESAINLTKILSQNSSNLPSEIIFIGSCGLYKDGKILEIYESKIAVNDEISALLKLSYSPIRPEFNGDVSHETIITNSSNFITTDKKSAEIFFQKGYFLENMEFYSVVKVAEIFKIPCLGIFCATNFCDQNAHDDFIKNHAKAKEKLEIYLKSKGFV